MQVDTNTPLWEGVLEWATWKREMLTMADSGEKPVRVVSDHTKLIYGHDFPCKASCLPTWQRGADGTMWLECQHLRYVVEES